MASYGGFCGKPGRFWMVQSFIDGTWFYWEGIIDPVTNTNIYSHDRQRAAQFLSEEAANFAADMMGGPHSSRRVEEHVFQTMLTNE